MGASSAARAARIAAELDGMPYLRLLKWDDPRRDAARMFIAHLEPEVAATLALMAHDYGCTEEVLVYRVWGNAVQAWLEGRK